MKEFNVLGASDRNKRAIQLALTIPGSKTVAGGATPDLKFKEDPVFKGEFIHPFKMSIIDDEGTKYLNIHEGKITISNNTQSRTWVAYFDQDALDLSEISTSGEYYAMLAIKYDPIGTGDDHDNTDFPCNVYFVKSDTTTNLVPGTRGFQTISIGKIKTELDDNDNLIFSISRQDLTSDLFLEFNSLNHPFSITANSDEFEDGSIKDSYSLSDFEFHVQQGTVIIQNIEFPVNFQDFTVNQNTYVYCSVNEEILSAGITSSTSRLPYFDQQNKIYNHCIGYISFNSQTYGIKIDQYIHDSIGGGSDTYKVKAVEDDDFPNYLSAKFVFDPENNQYPLKSYSNSLIGGLGVSSVISGQNNYSIKPIWMWQNISGYDKNKKQYLLNDDGDLAWISKSIEISGSLSNWEELNETSGKTILRWKPEFDTNSNLEQFYFMSSVKTDGVGHPSILSGLSFGKDTNKKQSVMLWSDETGLPIVSTPPAQTSQVSSWMLVGSQTSGLTWSPYIYGDFYKVKVTDQDPSGNFLSDKLDSLASSLIFSIENDGEQFISIDINPDYFFSSDDSISIEETEDGLDFTISSYLVQVSENDDPDYLGEKISSDNGSLSSVIESDDGYEYVNLEINPDYFYSSDGTISIEETNNGLDFTLSLSSYLVQVSADDDPDYLGEKITSLSGSLDVFIDSSGESETVNVEINPGYFYSSDESINIEETQNGLDFTISSYLVQVTANDDPDYLGEKITSLSSSLDVSIESNGESESVNVEINPDYFYSSDNSINIEETQDGLDFTLSSYLVQVTANDEPGYLSEKIDSTSGSILVSVESDGESEIVNLEIDPSYFYSSDDSVTIEETEDGLDFTGAGKVQVTANDDPGYLSEKIDSTSGSILVSVGSDGESEIVNLEIDPNYFYSSNGSINIDETANGLDFTISSYLVQVTSNDEPGYLGEKIVSENESILVSVGSSGEDEAVNLEIDPNYFYSSDGSIDIAETEDGLDFTSLGMVAVSDGDELGFLSEKLTSERHSIQISSVSGQAGDSVSLEIEPTWFISSDNSIDVIPTTAFIDFKSRGTVKCTANDNLGYLNSKINIDSSIASLITLEKQTSQILIKSALSGTGIMLLNNGQISLLQPPAGGNYLLACSNGSFSWIEYASCENACSGQV